MLTNMTHGMRPSLSSLEVTRLSRCHMPLSLKVGGRRETRDTPGITSDFATYRKYDDVPGVPQISQPRVADGGLARRRTLWIARAHLAALISTVWLQMLSGIWNPERGQDRLQRT